MELKAVVACSSNALDGKGKPIGSISKGGVIDVSDEVADELLRHVHPEYGHMFKRADGKGVEINTTPVTVPQTGNIRPGNAVR